LTEMHTQLFDLWTKFNVSKQSKTHFSSEN
jgi:hypothetical protein